MIDALGGEISLSKLYAFTDSRGGVKSTFIGTVSPISQTHVTMHVSETLCFSVDGLPFENRTWAVNPPSRIHTVSLFPLASLQKGPDV